MNILARYIIKTIMLSTAFALLVFAGVFFVVTLLAEFKAIGMGDYGIVQAICYVLLRLPTQLYQFLPMVILIGSILGLSLLASNHELSVMRISGFSLWKIIHSTLLAALFLTLGLSVIGEWLAPALSYKAEIRKENQQTGGQSVVTASGIWFHVKNNFIHVNQVVARQLLEGVTRYQFDDDLRLQAAYYAKTMAYHKDGWLMNDVVVTNFGDHRTTSVTLPHAQWDLKFNPNLLRIGLINPNEMSLPKIASFMHYLKKNGLQAGQYQYELWRRLFQPFGSLVMIFLAIPFVLGTLKSSTLSWRLIVGLMMGFVFYILNAFLGQLFIVYQLPIIIAVLFPPMTFAGFGFLLSNRYIK